MDYSLLAYTLINDMNQESRSALPDAPVVPARRTGRALTRLSALNGWLASGLHQAAWAIESALHTGSRVVPMRWDLARWQQARSDLPSNTI